MAVHTVVETTTAGNTNTAEELENTGAEAVMVAMPTAMEAVMVAITTAMAAMVAMAAAAEEAVAVNAGVEDTIRSLLGEDTIKVDDTMTNIGTVMCWADGNIHHYPHR